MPERLLARVALLVVLVVAGCQGGRSSGGAATGTLATLAPPSGSLLPGATVGVLYSQTISVVSGGGAPYALSISNAPPGLVLGPGTPSGTAFVLSGTPTTAGSFTPQVHVVDSLNFSTFATYQLTVQPGPTSIAISPSSLAQAQVNAPYTQTLTALSSVPPYQWSIGTGGLPPGMVLGPGPNATTTISGACAFAGTYVFTVDVVDASSPPLKGSTFYALSVH